MLRPRIIPVLLLDNRRLVKTLHFQDPKYIGDPVTALKIFNEKEVDELIVLDMTATRQGREPDFGFIEQMASECFMPFCYGGGIRNLEQIRRILKSGAEKIALNSCLLQNPGLVSEASSVFGSQSVVVSLDVKKTGAGYGVFPGNGPCALGEDPVRFAQRMEKAGAGEILVNSIDQDGMMEGYDHELVSRISGAVGIPVIACGGAGDMEDFRKVLKDSKASAAAAGSYFVFCGSRDAILITYPDSEEIEELLVSGGKQ